MTPSAILDQTVEPRWWVAFCDTDSRRWYKPFLRPGFHHCYAFAALDDDVFWIEAQPDRLAFGVRINDTAASLIEQARALGHTVLHVGRINSFAARPSIFLTCTAVVAYAMCIDSRAVTPYGLYRDLIRRYGAEQIR